MTDTLLTPRAYLVTLGLAKEFADDGVTPARGRFSKEGTAALDKAKAEGMTFAEATPKVKAANSAPKAERVVVAPAAKAAPLPEVDPKEVRAWAAQNGHEVKDRGRLNGATVRAFLAAGGKATVPTAKRPTPLDMPKRRPETVGYAVERNTLIALTSCAERKGGGCGKKIAHCACNGGPKAAHFLDAGVAGTPLLLTKPVV